MRSSFPVFSIRCASPAGITIASRVRISLLRSFARARLAGAVKGKHRVQLGLVSGDAMQVAPVSEIEKADAANSCRRSLTKLRPTFLEADAARRDQAIDVGTR